jgi:uncharacterized membrane protein YcaP (DUF421 family)
VDRIVDRLPLVIVEDGKPRLDRMKRSRVDVSDVLTGARKLKGLERVKQINYAVLVRSGGISIIPRQGA